MKLIFLLFNIDIMINKIIIKKITK